MTEATQNEGPLFKHSKEKFPWFERCTILRGLVGSTAHGTHVNDGSEDRDEMGVCVEPLSAMIGADGEFEQMIFRTAAEREGKSDAKSYAGDLDLTVYSLRKWVRLALQGNPTVLLLLFLPPEMCVTRTKLGAELQALAPAFASRQAGYRFAGFLDNQRKQLIGERSAKVNRPELIEKYGFDTKAAMNTLRLGMQGIQFLTTGSLQLPMAEHDGLWLRSVRTGQVPKEDVVRIAGELQAKLNTLTETSHLPARPDEEQVWQFVRRVYLNAWAGDRDRNFYGHWPSDSDRNHGEWR